MSANVQPVLSWHKFMISSGTSHIPLLGWGRYLLLQQQHSNGPSLCLRKTEVVRVFPLQTIVFSISERIRKSSPILTVLPEHLQDEIPVSQHRESLDSQGCRVRSASSLPWYAVWQEKGFLVCLSELSFKQIL